MTRLTAAALAIALVATSCSGDDDAASVTTITPVTDQTVDTTEPTTAPTTAPIAVTPTTSPATTSAPAATEPDDPATTTEPTATTEPDEIRRAVLDAVVESWRVFNEAKLDPTNDDKVAALSEVRGGELLAASVELIAGYRFENRRSITNEEFPSMLVPDADSLRLTKDGMSATLESCRVNSNASVEIGGNPDGTDRIVDDSISVYIESAELEMIGGQWIEVGGAIIERLEGATSCDRS